MSELFKGINLNTVGDGPPWAPKETNVFKEIIDAVAIGTVEGTLTNAKFIGHRHWGVYSQNTNSLALEATPGENIIIHQNLQILSMTPTPGFVKNDASGNLTGGNIIDIADIIDQLPPHFLNGFEDRTESAMEFDDSQRKFIIGPSGPGDYVIWSNNTKYTKSSVEDIIVPDAEGPVIIYFDDNGDLAFTTDANEDNIFLRWALVAVVSWNVTDQILIFLGEERHGIIMSPMTTLYAHRTIGARLAHEPGFALNGFTISGGAGTGDDDEDAQFGVNGGAYWNEDINLDYTSNFPQAISPIVNAPVYFLTGSAPNFRKTDATAFPVKPFVGGSGRLAFNEDIGGTWQQTEVTNNDYVLCHIFVTNELNEPIIAIQGQVSYTILADAQDGAEQELLSLSVLIPTNEIIPVATVIYQTGNGDANAVQAHVVLNGDGTEYIDWRFLRVGGAALGTQNDHNALFNLTVGDAHPQYMKIAGRATGQTLIGGTGSNENIRFSTTADGTKGSYVFTEMTSAGLLKNDPNGVVTGGNQADLTSDVTGVLPIANGGTNAITEQLAFDNLSPTTTKGDTIVRDSANNVRVPVGDDGQILIADSATSAGVSWGNVTGGGGLSFDYRFSNSTTPPPPDKRIIYNTAGQIDAAQMHVDKDTDSGADVHNLLVNLNIGDRIILFRNNDAGQFQEWVISSVTDNTGYISYGITFITDGGSLFLNGDRIVFAVFGASSGSVTRQNTYDNSGAPQTTTSDAKGELIVRRGTTGGDDDKVFEIQAASGTPTFSIHGDGNSEVGRSDYTSFENIPTSGDVLEGDAFITTDSSIGRWRFELANSNNTLRLGHDANTANNDMTIGSLSDANMIDAIRLVAQSIIVKGPITNEGEFDLLKDGTGGPRSFRYKTSTTTSAPPGTNQVRYNNSTQSSATAIFVDDDALSMGAVGALLANVDTSATLYISNEGKTKFQQFVISNVQDQGAYVEFTVTHSQSFGGNMSSEEVVQFVLQEGAGGGSAAFPSFQFYADQFDSPVNVDWVVNSLAPSASDTNNNGLNVRRFRPGTDDGVGFTIRIPTGATDIIFTIQSRAESTPAGTVSVALNMYEREIPDNAVPTAWSSGLQMTPISLPTNEFFQTDTQTISLATLGLAVDQTHQFELVRDTGDLFDTLLSDWSLLFLGVNFA